MSELLNVQEAAKFLKVHPASLYRFIRSGAVPVVRIGNALRFSPAALESFIEKGGTVARAQG